MRALRAFSLLLLVAAVVFTGTEAISIPRFKTAGVDSSTDNASFSSSSAELGKQMVVSASADGQAVSRPWRLSFSKVLGLKVFGGVPALLASKVRQIGAIISRARHAVKDAAAILARLLLGRRKFASSQTEVGGGHTADPPLEPAGTTSSNGSDSRNSSSSGTPGEGEDANTPPAAPASPAGAVKAAADNGWGGLGQHGGQEGGENAPGDGVEKRASTDLATAAAATVASPCVPWTVDALEDVSTVCRMPAEGSTKAAAEGGGEDGEKDEAGAEQEASDVVTDMAEGGEKAEQEQEVEGGGSSEEKIAGDSREDGQQRYDC